MNISSQKAETLRDALFLILGKHCVHCGSRSNLTFDIKIPESVDLPLNHHRKFSWYRRMKFYRTQMLKGNLQVLCSSCNTKKRNSQPLLFIFEDIS
jgi:5-methylcytosine-specific restriction endonuclease McrA